MQERWGCPGGGFAPRALDDECAREARHFARVVGVYRGPEDEAMVPTTCPLRPIMVADPYTIEITRACCGVGVDGGYRHADYGALLGREPTHVDVEAYLTWREGHARASASDREFARKAAEKPKPSR